MKTVVFGTNIDFCGQILAKDLFSIDTFIANAFNIVLKLNVEKRRKPRPPQLSVH